MSHDTEVEGDVEVARLLEMDAPSSANAVLALRRELGGADLRWTLGGLGTFELDAAFVGMQLTGGSPFDHQRITTTARLWSPNGAAVVPVDVTLASARRPPSELSIAPSVPLPPSFAADVDAYEALARAALDELAEELLYHCRVTQRS